MICGQAGPAAGRKPSPPRQAASLRCGAALGLPHRVRPLQQPAALGTHLAAARVLRLVAQQRGQRLHLAVHGVRAAVHHGQPAVGGAVRRGGDCEVLAARPARAAASSGAAAGRRPRLCLPAPASCPSPQGAHMCQTTPSPAPTCRGRCSRPSAPPRAGAPPPPWRTPQTAGSGV